MREDLHEQSLHPTGVCGFEFSFPYRIDLDNELPLSIRANGHSTPFTTFHPDQVLDVINSAGRLVFFMHIPKTAGTSFCNYAPLFFGYKRAESHIERLGEPAQKALLNDHDFLAGHLTLGQIGELVPDINRVDLHTLLREPYHQLHSHLAWVKGVGAKGRGEFFHQHHPVVQDLALRLGQVNLASVSALRSFVDTLDGFEIDFFDNIQTRYFLDYRPARVSMEDFDQALKNLNYFKTIGVTEKYHDYTRAFCRHYEIRHVEHQTEHNPSRVPPLFNFDRDDTREILAPLVRYDLQLYARAKDINGESTGNCVTADDSGDL